MQIKIGDYEFLPTKQNLLGQGAYGQVYRCKKTNTQEEYCVKVVNKANIKDSVAKSLKRESDILKEIQTQNCENLVQIYDVIDQLEYLYIIMEICDYDLSTEFDMLKNQNTWYSENDQIEIIQQIVQGFQGLYQMSILHRDIKPKNILVKIINKDTPQQQKIYKITDFGFSRFLDDLMKRGNFTRVGTLAYVAPQIFFGNEFSGKCDIFSYGVVFYQLAHQGNHPKPTAEQIKNFLLQLQTNPLQCQIQGGQYIQELSHLIEKMMTYSEEDRINFTDIFEHPIMKIKLGSITQDSIFLHILRPEQQYLQDKIEKVQKDKIHQRLERIHQILSVFFRKFLLLQNTVDKLQDHLNDIIIRVIVLHLYQLGLLQLTYAMGMIHSNISDLHTNFKEDYDILHLLEILEECKIAVKNNENEKLLRKNINLKFLDWQKAMFQYNDSIQIFLITQQQNDNIQTYLGYSANLTIKRMEEKSIYEVLQKLVRNNPGLPHELHQQLIKAQELEIRYPIQEYQKINLNEIFEIQ